MIKKIICEFEDVKLFEKFQMHDENGYLRKCIKVPLLEHKIIERPVPGDLRTRFDWKANAIDTQGWNDYIFVKPNKEVFIYPS